MMNTQKSRITRQGDRLSFTDEQQQIFNVPATESVRSAVDMAMSFNEVAAGVIQRLAQEADATDMPELSHYHAAETRRAHELGHFAGQVLKLCPDEHLEAILQAAR